MPLRDIGVTFTGTCYHRINSVTLRRWRASLRQATALSGFFCLALQNSNRTSSADAAWPLMEIHNRLHCCWLRAALIRPV